MRRALRGSPPRWARPRYVLFVASVCVAVPVAVSLLRASHFDTTLEVFPATLPGNLVVGDASAPSNHRTPNFVSNPDFEYDTSGWADPPTFAVRRSVEQAHSGIAALASWRDLRTPKDGNTGYSYVGLPGPGRYQVGAWVRLPRRYTGGPPAVYLEGFSGSTLRAQKLGNPRLRDSWQRVSSEYAISGQDLAGSLVLRTIGSLPRRGQVLYWDDVVVPALLRAEAPGGRAAARQSQHLESLLADQQLRLEVALAAGKDLYRSNRVTVSQSPRADALSFLVTAESDTPNDARRLAGPLRAALAHAATRSRTQRAQERLDEITSRLEGNPGAGQRALLERRADDLRLLIAAQPPDFVVASSDSEADPDRLVDRILDILPGALPPRPHPAWVGAAGLLATLVVFGTAIAFTAVRGAAAPR